MLLEAKAKAKPDPPSAHVRWDPLSSDLTSSHFTSIPSFLPHAALDMPEANARPAWLFYAIASGGCAALNGAFAKLTTTELTATWATSISQFFGFKDEIVLVEYLIRGFFFAMNLVFNGVMWGLFTRALTLASSTVRVSVINTSANFIVTAVLGALVFREALPGLWWLGAAMLVAGSVIIGRREEGKEGDAVDVQPEVVSAPYSDEPDDTLPSVGTSDKDEDLLDDRAYEDSDAIERMILRGEDVAIDDDVDEDEEDWP